MIETLYTFWNNICLWYTENEQTITAFFMSGQFVSLIAAIVMLVKNIKQIKNNTSSTSKLDNTLTKTNEMAGELNCLKEDVKTLTEDNSKLSEELNETREKLQYSNSLIADKLNSILEVQTIVYSTIRDDSVRQTVNTILNNARYSEKNFKEQLEHEIESLKEEFEHKMADVNESVTNAVRKVSDSVNAAETAKNRAKELHGIDEPTRY